MKHHWTTEGRKYMRQTGGKKTDKKQFYKLFQSAWKNSATVETAQSGFRQTGIFPVNRNAIPVEVFEPSKTTERRSQTVTKEGTSSTEVASSGEAVSVAEVITDAQPGMSVSDTTPSSKAVTDAVADPEQGTSSTEVASYSQAVTDAEVATDLQQSMSTSDTMTASGLI